MKKVFSRILRLLPFAILSALLLLFFFYPKRGTGAKAEKRVVTVWNVDTFEGGKGSRTAFLKRAAKRAEAGREGVYYLVSSYTAEGAEAAYASGSAPDVLSFGVGLSVYAEKSLPLPRTFAGGMAGECLAYPWCRGRYSLFSLTDDFTAEGKTAISSGGSNLPVLAARYNGVEGEVRESLAAYSGFLSGEYRYLLGTQRDECRFAARGTEVFRKELNAYCDLYQYFSVLNAEKREDALALFEVLLGKETQGALGEIGMLPVEGASGYTVSVFSSAETLLKLREDALAGGDRKNLDKYLKSI